MTGSLPISLRLLLVVLALGEPRRLRVAQRADLIARHQSGTDDESFALSLSLMFLTLPLSLLAMAVAALTGFDETTRQRAVVASIWIFPLGASAWFLLRKAGAVLGGPTRITWADDVMACLAGAVVIWTFR